MQLRVSSSPTLAYATILIILFVLTGLGLSLHAATAQSLQADTLLEDPLQFPRPSLHAHFTTDPIALDGRLLEDAWKESDSTDGTFWQIIPDQGYPSTERTVMRVLYDEARLYIGARLYDSEPDKLVAAGLEQDYRTQDSDILGIAIDTYLDRQNAFLFAVNPAGALFDAQAFNDQSYVNRSWEGVVEVKTTQDEKGWVVELGIPFTTLRFNESDSAQVWGLNFSRRIRRKSEDAYWAPLARQHRVYKMSLAGTLTGLENLNQGRNLNIKPYMSGNSTGAYEYEYGLDAGLDVKWGITPRLTLDATLFTDFSQVEVDQQQVNLTRFSLFFPEQRDFFLENDGVFNFADVRIRNYRTGSGPQNFKLFHSRRIGLSSDRSPVPIAAGLRLTGRAGRNDIGILNMQTRDRDLFPGENFSVFRIRRNVLTSSDIGVMLTNRMHGGWGSDSFYNRTAGVDGNFRILGNLLVNAYLATSDVSANTSPNLIQSSTGALQVAWRDPLWDTSFLLKSVGEDFEPGIGFVSRRGVRQAFLTFGAHPQPAIRGVFELNPFIDFNTFTNFDGRLETRELVPGMAVVFRNSAVLEVEVGNRLERLVAPTAIAGAEVAAGEYTYSDLSVSYLSDSGKRLSSMITLVTGSFFDGERRSIGGTLTWRPGPRWYLYGSAERNQLTLGGSSFEANLYGFRLRYGHNTRTFLSAFLQYNQAAEQFITNLRFNLIHAPLSDLFIVLQDVRNLDDDPLTRSISDRSITLKLTRMFAF